MADVQIVRPEVSDVPAEYLLAPAAEFVLKTVNAAFTDNGAATDWLPCVEIVSDSNTPARLKLKTEQYFAHGSEEVWIVYPKTGTVRMHYPNGNSQTVAEGELRSDLFPGWSIPVDSLFHD